MSAIAVDIVLTLVASSVYLAVTVVAGLRGRRGKAKTGEPVALLLAMLCLDLFAYNGLQLIWDLSGQTFWHSLNAAAACPAPALFYHLVIGFVGQRRRYRRALIASYIYFGSLGAACVAAAFFSVLEGFPNGQTWAVLTLAGLS